MESIAKLMVTSHKKVIFLRISRRRYKDLGPPPLSPGSLFDEAMMSMRYNISPTSQKRSFKQNVKKKKTLLAYQVGVLLKV